MRSGLLRARIADSIRHAAGEDVFFDIVYGPDAGDDDIITDFKPGLDVLVLDEACFDGYDYMLRNTEQVGSEIVIYTGDGSITLLNAELDGLQRRF